jgi:hypothetical protein
MTAERDLHFYEEIMLLALKDEKGTLEAAETSFLYTMAASFLAELFFLRRIRLDPSGKKSPLVTLDDATPTGDPILDECLGKLKEAKRRGPLTTWVSRFAGIKKLRDRVAQQLCRRGILRADEDKVLLVFKRKIYPELDPRPEKALIQRLHEAIFTDTDTIDPRTAVLVSLADKAGVLPNVFDKKELKARKDRIGAIGKGDVTAAAAKEVIDSVTTMILTTIIMPGVAISTFSAN